MRLNHNILVMAGCSAAGKSTTMQALASLDSRFAPVVPLTTRLLRPDEVGKIHVPGPELDRLEKDGALLQVNALYGARYGTPLEPFLRWPDQGLIPVVDWPVHRMIDLQRRFADRIFSVYIEPPSMAILQARLLADGRDADGRRFWAATSELKLLRTGAFGGLIDLHLVSRNEAVPSLAKAIQVAFFRSEGPR